MDVLPETIGLTIAPEHTRKEPFGRLMKELSGTMTVKIGTESKVESLERTKIGLSTKAHGSMTVHGLRTIDFSLHPMSNFSKRHRIAVGSTTFNYAN